MDACYCDYEPAELYHQETRLAKKEHRCSECEPTSCYLRVAVLESPSFREGRMSMCLCSRPFLEDPHEAVVDGLFFLLHALQDQPLLGLCVFTR